MTAALEEFPVDHDFAATHGVLVSELDVDGRVGGLLFTRRPDETQPTPPPKPAPIVLDRPPRPLTRRMLTAREVDVLTLVADGLPNADIGARLHVAEDTIKAILRTVFRKLRVSHRSGAVAVAFQWGLLR